MPIRSRQYNNPAIGAAFSNLASIFAPPSGSDLAGYANAAATRQQAERIAQLWADPNLDEWDKRAIAAGLYNPTQSFYAQDQNNAATLRGQDITAETQRYGYDTQAATSRANNAADNERALATNVLDNQRSAIGSLFGPLNQGQVAPAVPQEFMDILGLPSVDERVGAPKPLSETEHNASVLAGMPLEQQQAVAFGSTPIEQIVMGDGPINVTRPDAIGQTPYDAQSQTKPTNMLAVLPDGTNVPAVQAPDGGFVHAQTGERLPNDIQIFNVPTPTGSAEDVGLTNATTSRVQQQIIATEQTLDTARQLRSLIEGSPSSQGLVGTLRGTAQDVVQTGNDLGQFFGGEMANVAAAVNEGLMDAGVAAEFFDPSIPAIEMLTNLLAWQYAKSLSGERVSNEQLRAARDAIGGSGIFANRANSLTRLDNLIGSWERQLEQLRPLNLGLTIGGVPAAPPAGGETPQQNEPIRITSDNEYNALPSGAPFIDPEGNLRRKP